MTKKIPRRIPKKFWHLFWDTNPAKINVKTDSLIIAQRALDKGNLESVRWVRSILGDKILRKALCTFRDFSPRVSRFWQLFLNIPASQMPCLNKHYLQMRRQHWPY